MRVIINYKENHIEMMWFFYAIFFAYLFEDSYTYSMKYILLCITAFFASMTMMMPSFVDASNSAFGKWSSVTANWELSIGWLNWWDIQRNDKSLDVIKWAVNWVLWLGWLIALIMLIYWWILMVTSQWEDGYEKWRKVVKAAVIGLLIIWLAWFIVSLWLWLAQETGNPAKWAAWTES